MLRNAIDNAQKENAPIKGFLKGIPEGKRILMEDIATAIRGFLKSLLASLEEAEGLIEKGKDATDITNSLPSPGAVLAKVNAIRTLYTQKAAAAAKADRIEESLQRSIKEHHSKVLKQKACHIREKNFWKSLHWDKMKKQWIGYRTCDLCSEVLNRDKKLGKPSLKALRNTTNYQSTKPKNKGEKPQMRKNWKPKIRKMIPQNKGIADKVLGHIEIFYDDDGSEVWTIRDMKKYSDTGALRYLIGTSEHEDRFVEIQQQWMEAQKILFEEEIKVDAKKLEEATHMARPAAKAEARPLRRKVKLPTTRGAPVLAETSP